MGEGILDNIGLDAFVFAEIEEGFDMADNANKIRSPLAVQRACMPGWKNRGGVFWGLGAWLLGVNGDGK